MTELYKKYRPKTIKAFHGNESVKKVLTSWLAKEAVPHCVLFTGPSGCGKTTLARILREKLDCGDVDFQEINAAGQDNRGIEKVKKIEGQLGMAPMNGCCRIFLIDEAHKLTSDAQNAFLKILEDTPKHIYFFLCTTDPQKLIPTIRTRSSVVAVKPLPTVDMLELLELICKKESIEVSDKVRNLIASVSEGSSRKALVLLEQASHLEEEDAQIEAIHDTDERRKAIELCRLLMNPRAQWKDVAAMIKGIEELEPESFRWMMLSYATSVVLGGGKMANRAYVILDQFATNYFDTKMAGLVADCWTVVNGRSDE